MELSGWRTAWILGTWGLTFFATAVAAAAEGMDGDMTSISFVVVVASIAPLLLVHELGHALAAVAVGYRVTGIHLTTLGDGMTEIERPPGRETVARDIVFIAAGPALTLAAIGTLFLAPLEGFGVAWRAGLATFGLLWTLDILAPIERAFGVDRDGLVLAQLLRERRQGLGLLTEEERAILHEIDQLILSRRLNEVRIRIPPIVNGLTDDDLALWGALFARAAIVEMLLGEVRDTGRGSHADRFSADAVRLLPRDPVCVGARRWFEERISGSPPSLDGVREPTEEERRLLAMCI